MKTKRKRRNIQLVGPDEKWESTKLWLESGVDLEKRTISIIGDIDDDTAKSVLRGVRKLVEIDPEAAIDVEITSDGGDIYIGFAIYSALTQCPMIVRTHAKGKVMSSGLLIYAAGDERYSDYDATFMFHGITDRGVNETENQLDVGLAETKRLNENFAKAMVLASNKRLAWWKNKTKHNDFYFDYYQAVELELVNEEYDFIE